MSLKIDTAITIANPPAVKRFATSIPAAATASAGFWTTSDAYVDPDTLDVAPRAGSVHLIPSQSDLPTLAVDSITGRKALVFPGGATDRRLFATGVFDGGSKSLAVAFNTAVEVVSGSNCSLANIYFNNASGTDYALRMHHEVDKFAIFDAFNSQLLSWPSIPGVGAWHWAIMAIKTNEIALSVDGGDFITHSIGAMATSTGTYDAVIGGRFHADGTYYQGSIENLICDKGYAPDNAAWVAEVNLYMTRLYR